MRSMFVDWCVLYDRLYMFKKPMLAFSEPLKWESTGQGGDPSYACGVRPAECAAVQLASQRPLVVFPFLVCKQVTCSPSMGYPRTQEAVF